MSRHYNIYPSLLDTFQGYLDSSEIYQQFWGFSENPSMTELEFEQKQFDDLINKINRVPFESDAANLGTAFNLAVDYCITGQLSDEIQDFRINDDKLSLKYKNENYVFEMAILSVLKNIYQYSASQIFVERDLITSKGNIRLYGYADYLTPFAWHDLKTTSRYKSGKYYKSWQRIVYPYAGESVGVYIKDFQFDVVLWTKQSAEIFTEFYRYIPEHDLPRLVEHCERFIDFLENHRHLITDFKIFN